MLEKTADYEADVTADIQAAPETAQAGRDSLFDIRRLAVLIFCLTLADKAFALLKESVLAYRFGISMDIDVFNLAYAFPGLLSLLFGNALIAATVPLYSAWSASGQGRLRRSLAAIGWSSLALGVSVSVACCLGAGYIIDWLGYGFSSEGKTLGVTLERALVWLVALECLSAFRTGVLHARKKFFVSQLAQMGINVGIISVILLWSDAGVWGLAVGFLVGTGAKLLIMTLSRDSRVGAFSSSKPDMAALREFGNLVWPMIIGGLIVNANILVDQVMSTTLPTGSLSALRYANRINDLPLQTCVVAASTALFPFISEFAVKNDMDSLRQLFWRGLLFILFISLPMIGFIQVFPEDIVSVLLRRGAFDAAALAETSRTLVCYNLGMAFYAYTFINSSFFNALRMNKTLMAVGIATAILNVLFNYLFIRLLHGPEAIALSSAVTALITCLTLSTVLNRRLSLVRYFPAIKPFLLVGLYAILAAGSTWLLREAARQADITGVIVFVPLAALFGAIYAGGLLLSRDPDIRWCLGFFLPFVSRLLRLFRRRGPGSRSGSEA